MRPLRSSTAWVRSAVSTLIGDPCCCDDEHIAQDAPRLPSSLRHDACAVADTANRDPTAAAVDQRARGARAALPILDCAIAVGKGRGGRSIGIGAAVIRSQAHDAGNY